MVSYHKKSRDKCCNSIFLSRISCLLSIFKREFDESERSDRIRRGGSGGSGGGGGSDVRGIDLEAIAAQGCKMHNGMYPLKYLQC